MQPNQALPLAAVALVLLAIGCGSQEANTTKGESQQNSLPGEHVAQQGPPVRVELLADCKAVQASSRFMLAAYFELPEGCYAYWENAGEGGVPPMIQVSAPEGFVIGETLYPGPQIKEFELEAVSYVYEGEFALFVPVEAPAELDAELTLDFELDVTWFVREADGFQQQAKLGLQLPVHEEPGDPEAANAAKLDPQRELLPKPRAELEGLQWQWMGSPPDYRALTVVGGATQVDFFPGLEANMIVEKLVRNPGGNAYEMAIDFSMTPGQEQDEPMAIGVLRVVMRGEDPRYYAVDFTDQ